MPRESIRSVVMSAEKDAVKRFLSHVHQSWDQLQVETIQVNNQTTFYMMEVNSDVIPKQWDLVDTDKLIIFLFSHIKFNENDFNKIKIILNSI